LRRNCGACTISLQCSGSTLTAATEINPFSVPRTAIDARWEYNGLTEVNETGFAMRLREDRAPAFNHQDPM
jgi:hypothetical protein